MKNTAKNKGINGTGLHPLPVNPGKRKDIDHAVVFGALGAAQLPTEDFTVADPLRIKNQKDLDFCTGFASSEVTEDQEGIEMDPLFQFAAIKRQLKDWKAWGADLRSAGMALVNFGSLPEKFAPFNIGEQTRDFLANWENYPAGLWQLAAPFKKQTMFFVGGPHTLFWNIVMTLWQNRKEKRSVLLGTVWRKSWTNAPGGVIPEWTPIEQNDVAGGHCVKGFGLKGLTVPVTIKGKPYLKIQNSWGEDIGEGGIFYFPESVINKEFGPYGQITFKDMDPEDAHYYNENSMSINDNWLLQLVKVLASVFFEIFTKIKTGLGL